jgi:hypothetical protein
MTTINQSRLIKSIQLKAAAMNKTVKANFIAELLAIKVAYQNEESGYTFELALQDLWDRMNEKPERKVA